MQQYFQLKQMRCPYDSSGQIPYCDLCDISERFCLKIRSLKNEASISIENFL